MSIKFKIATINDEIDGDLDKAIMFLKRHKVNFVELRTINKKNIINYPFSEIKAIHRILECNDIKVSAYASPLFKWYPTLSDQAQNTHAENFDFEPNLSLKEKYKYIEKAIEIAKTLDTKNLRIFSSLKSSLDAEYSFSDDPMLCFALEEARREGVKLLLENEPPCYIHSIKDIRGIADKYYKDGLRIWFDVANFYKINEQVSSCDLEALSDKIAYIHLKDFDIHGDYVPLGNGIIDYRNIINEIKNFLGNKDIFLSIETHINHQAQKGIAQSIDNLRNLLV